MRQKEGGRPRGKTTILSCGEAVLYTEGYLFHPQVQAHLGVVAGGIIKCQETHWNLILCIPGVCPAGFLCSSSAHCFHPVLHQRRHSLLHQLWTAYGSRAFVPGDPGGDMTFFMRAVDLYWSLVIYVWVSCSSSCIMTLLGFDMRGHPNTLRETLTHVHSGIHSLTHYVPIVAVRRHCIPYTPGSGSFVHLFCIKFKKLNVYGTVYCILVEPMTRSRF